MLQVRQLPVGMLRANCYFIYNEKEILIVDPGADADNIESVVSQIGGRVVGIILTHAHYDHIGAVEDIRDLYGAEVYMCDIEKDWLQDPMKNLSGGSWRQEVTARPADHYFQLGDYCQIGDFSFKVVHTPGHSPGSVSFIFDEAGFVVSGDTIFNGTIGRTDLPQADFHTLKNSIRREIFSLDDDFTIYPGHGATTTVGQEYNHNPFFNSTYKP